MYVNHMSQPLAQRLRTAEEPASEILAGHFHFGKLLLHNSHSQVTSSHSSRIILSEIE